jgi:diadenosine tetraphosphatase ApaH/serine/threonine PP2A family protein phosphatase
MRVAVISDIHGNLAALTAVLAAVDAEAPDELWCLGDVVGYGPRPNECCALVAERAAVCLAGNHDLAVLGAIDVAEFTGHAAHAARWTQTVLADDARTFLAALDSTSERDGVALFHGSPRDPVWDYVLDDTSAWESFRATTSPLLLVGHSHVALQIVNSAGEVAGGLAREGTELDLGSARWLLNPGSVGQPRDGDARAAYLMIDLDARRAAFRRVPYPVGQTQDEIREAGLPEALAARLEHGA